MGDERSTGGPGSARIVMKSWLTTDHPDSGSGVTTLGAARVHPDFE